MSRKARVETPPSAVETSPPGKVRVETPPIRVRVYPLVSDAIAAEIRYGIRRVFKYDDHPRTEDELLEAADTIHQAVMSGVCELLDFGDD